MQPRLYDAYHDFNYNGYGLLKNCAKCDVTEELNGEYFCELEVLPTDRLAQYIVPGTFIRAKPNDDDKPQLFEVNSAITAKNGNVAVTANHIKSYFFNNTIRPLTFSGDEYEFKGTAAEVVEDVTSKTKLLRPSEDENGKFYAYQHVRVKGFGNDTATLLQHCDTPYTMQQMFFDDGGIVDKFGGEFHFDDYTVSFLKNRGSATDKAIRYGRNISDYNQSLTNTDLYTSVCAYAKFADSDSGGTVVESDIMSTGYRLNNDLYFQRILMIDRSEHINTKKYDPTTDAGRKEIKEKLNNWLVGYIDRKRKKLTEPRANIRVTWQPMLDQLQQVRLGDTAKLIYTPNGLVTRVKAIKTVYNSLAERYKEIEFGEKKLTLKNYLKKANRR